MKVITERFPLILLARREFTDQTLKHAAPEVTLTINFSGSNLNIVNLA